MVAESRIRKAHIPEIFWKLFQGDFVMNLLLRYKREGSEEEKKSEGKRKGRKQTINKQRKRVRVATDMLAYSAGGLVLSKIEMNLSLRHMPIKYQYATITENEV